MFSFCFTVPMIGKKLLFLAFFLFYSAVFVYSQITTAAAFFSSVSEKYAKINNYTANIIIKNGNSSHKGTIKFKRPDKLRIDFSYPENQCIVFTGDNLTIYLPVLNVMLSQKVDSSSAGSASLATPQGLSLMRRSYTVSYAYETGSAPKPLEEGSSENVVVLAMYRRSAAETFKSLKVMISPESKLIRRIEGYPITGEKIVFDFYNYNINPGISSKAFLFDSPPTATVLNDFLFLE